MDDKQGHQLAGHHHSEAKREENICREQKVWGVKTQKVTFGGKSICFCVTEPPTQDRNVVPCDGQQVIHEQQENGVTQDERHLEGWAVEGLGRQAEAEDIQRDEEDAGQN